jgi:hypothetical protein
MKSLSPLLLPILCGLAACGGGHDDRSSGIDYSNLRVAASRDGRLSAATSDEQILAPLRNGVRMSLSGVQIAAGQAASADPSTFSHTTVQVDGVDESDPVEYDGTYIYSVHHQDLSPTRNVLTIARTDPATATTQPVAQFPLPETLNTQPTMYLLQSNAGATDSVVVLGQHADIVPLPAAETSLVQPNRTTVQWVDVHDPAQVFQAWALEFDGSLRASRKIGDTLYLISGFRPQLKGLKPGAQTDADKQANELLIRGAGVADLLPRYRTNDGADRPLVASQHCVLPADLRPDESYRELILITSISLSARTVVDATCLGTNVNGVHVSQANLYIGGDGIAGNGNPVSFTVLHKFALMDGALAYRASGRVDGTLNWLNTSYFMDEYRDDMRIVTASPLGTGHAVRLSVVRETAQGDLSVRATLPSATRPDPLGDADAHSTVVRFVGERGYIATSEASSLLVALDLHAPTDPFVAGQLEMPGIDRYLQPIASPSGQQLLLSLGFQTDTQGVENGVKLELIDATDATGPHSLGQQVVGGRGSASDALTDPHALALLPSADGTSYRVALPIESGVLPVEPNGGPGSTNPSSQYSAMHLFEIDGLGTGQPHLEFVGAIQPLSLDPRLPQPMGPSRAVLHDGSVFVVNGAVIRGRLWSDF